MLHMLTGANGARNGRRPTSAATGAGAVVWARPRPRLRVGGDGAAGVGRRPGAAPGRVVRGERDGVVAAAQGAVGVAAFAGPDRAPRLAAISLDAPRAELERDDVV